MNDEFKAVDKDFSNSTGHISDMSSLLFQTQQAEQNVDRVSLTKFGSHFNSQISSFSSASAELTVGSTFFLNVESSKGGLHFIFFGMCFESSWHRA